MDDDSDGTYDFSLTTPLYTMASSIYVEAGTVKSDGNDDDDMGNFCRMLQTFYGTSFCSVCLVRVDISR